MKNIPWRIEQPGAVIVNQCIVRLKAQGVYLLELDLHSKYVDCDIHGGQDEGPSIFLAANDDSLYLNSAIDRDVLTEILFPLGASWRVWSTWSGRYTVNVTLYDQRIVYPGLHKDY